uniref:F-box domain-containing protein n=1 Tax=Dracunculus medinensis TaxID=318479 RepID=A0A0N4U1B2_DRAME
LLQVISKSTKLIDVDREENVAFSLDADDNKASTSYSGTAVDGRQIMSSLFLLPPEIQLRILEHLPREEIDKCTLVCRQLKILISNNKRSLPKHSINQLIMEESKGCFKIKIRSDTFSKKWRFSELLSPRKRNLAKDDDGPRRKVAPMLVFCNIIEQISIPISAAELHGWEANERTGTHWERKTKLHTPPKSFFDRIARCAKFANIHHLSFVDMRLTDLFVDLLEESLGEQGIKCNTLKLERIKLRYISVVRFVKLMNLIAVENVEIDWIRGHNGHLTAESFVSKILNCRLIDIGFVNPSQPIYDDSFLYRFFDSMNKHKILLLEECQITNAGLGELIKKWYSSSRKLSFYIFLKCQNFDKNEFVNDHMQQAIILDGAYTIKHAILETKLCIRLYRNIIQVYTN